MTEKDLVFYMGGDIHYKDEVIANLKVDGPPLKYVLMINDEKIFFESREEAINRLIEILGKK